MSLARPWAFLVACWWAGLSPLLAWLLVVLLAELLVVVSCSSQLDSHPFDFVLLTSDIGLSASDFFMCGLLGLLAPGASPNLQSLLSLLTHRGPDDEGYYADGDVFLGARRLSIIDLAGGHQ